ncbi:MAG: hypothetical protein NZ529_01070 [Cytophagaceae bacterium]|nr:hypothetical protein [Cytophagaceae bacterium]MDW8455356.1 hypothetical protein [Cytophagaceae bacterium]
MSKHSTQYNLINSFLNLVVATFIPTRFVTYLLKVILTSMLTHHSAAQPAAVTNAILYFRNGEIDKAYKEILPACENEKTKQLPKTWYYKGLITFEMAKRKSEPDTILLNTSHDAFVKTIQLDKNKTEYFTLANQKLHELWVHSFNQAGENFNKKKYEHALALFETAHQIKTNDTTTLLYAAYTAEALKDFDKLLQYCENLLHLRAGNEYVYLKLLYIYMHQKPQIHKVEKLVLQAVDAYPENPYILQMLTEYYISQKEVPIGIEKLQQISKTKNNNHEILLALALLHDANNDKAEAIKYYQEVLNKKTDYYLPAYNLSVTSFNLGKQYAQNSNYEEAKKMYLLSLTYAQKALNLSKVESEKETLLTLISELEKLIK